MTVWGPLRVGRVTVTEHWQATEKTTNQGGRGLTLAGQEAAVVAGTQTAARDRAEGLLAMLDTVQPVAFTHQSHRDGWYRVTSAQADETTWHDHTDVRWRLELDRVGQDAEVEVESRLTGGNRVHASAAVAELWHAPAIGHGAYYVGSSTPGYVDRTGVDGAIRVYRSIPAATHPRWAVPAVSALAGAVSVTVDGTVLAGTTCRDTPASWALSNGLIRVEPRTSAGTLRVTSYLASGWGAAKVFDLERGTTSLGAAQHVTVLRNDPCEAVIRLTWNHAPGRTVADLTLTRGARHVGIYAQQYAAPTALRIDDTLGAGTVNNQLTAAGYIALTTSNADGNGWVIGSAQASTAAGTFGLAATVAATGLAGYIGCVRANASAVAGDTAAQVNSQWLGTPAQAERVIAR